MHGSPTIYTPCSGGQCMECSLQIPALKTLPGEQAFNPNYSILHSIFTAQTKYKKVIDILTGITQRKQKEYNEVRIPTYISIQQGGIFELIQVRPNNMEQYQQVVGWKIRKKEK